MNLRCIPHTGSLESKHPDHAAFRHLGLLAWKQAIERRLHSTRVAAPTRLDGDVLLAVDRKRRRRRENARVCRKLPEQLARRRFKGVELAITRAARQHQTPAR